MSIKVFLSIIGYLILAPLVGGLLAGLDRKITSRMQRRLGPPLFQPFYDVFKLWRKENVVSKRSQNLYVFFFLLFVIFTGCLFFAGGDMLLVIFALTLAGIFLVLGAFRASSPYSSIGAQRELLQMMAYEPMVILAAIGIYMVTKSFYVGDIVHFNGNLIKYLPGVFLGFVYILIIKFRKSPFDLSMSHHAHQEIVRGIITEFSGKTLALTEIAHWYENVFLLGFVYLFFTNNFLLGIIMCFLVYFVSILVDNVCARVKWQKLVFSSWIITLVFGFINIIVLHMIK